MMHGPVQRGRMCAFIHGLKKCLAYMYGEEFINMTIMPLSMKRYRLIWAVLVFRGGLPKHKWYLFTELIQVILKWHRNWYQLYHQYWLIALIVILISISWKKAALVPLPHFSNGWWSHGYCGDALFSKYGCSSDILNLKSHFFHTYVNVLCV